MMIIPLLEAAFRLSVQIHKFVGEEIVTFRIQSDENARHNVAIRALGYLDQFGGSFLDVESLRGGGGDDGRKDVELQVSIHYLTTHSQRENPIEQHRTFCLDFSSWEALENDINTLAGIYHEIYGCEVGFAEQESEEFWDSINQYCRLAQIKAKESLAKPTRQP